MTSRTRTPQGLLAPVWPSRDYPVSTMRAKRGHAWCETCRSNQPAPAVRKKGWKCRECKARAT